MAEDKTKEHYVLQWKNHLAEVLYGPCYDAVFDPDLSNRIRESVTKMYQEIDEVSELLDSQGLFDKE